MLSVAFVRKWGLAGKIAVPVVLLFGAFIAVLGAWVTRLSKDILLSVAADRAAALENSAWRSAAGDWDRFGQRLGNPLWAGQLKPVLESGNAEAVSRALSELAQQTGASFAHLYGRKLALAGSSSPAASAQEPPFLRALVEELAGEPAGTVRVTVVPPDVLAFEKVSSPHPTPPSGAALAVVASAPLLNETNERVGLLVGFRFLSGDDKAAAEIASSLGGDFTYLLDGVRVATSLTTGQGKSLAGSHVESVSPAAGRETLAGGTYLSRYRALPLWGTQAAGHLAVSLPISALLDQAARIQLQALAAGLAALGVFTGILTALVRRSLSGVPRILERMTAVSSGSLKGELKLRSGDEMETLCEGINTTVGKLRGLVGDVQSSFRQLEPVSATLVATAESLAAAAPRERDVVQSLDQTTASVWQVVEKLDAESRAVKGSAAENLAALQAVAASATEMASGSGKLADASGETASAMQEMVASFSASASNVSSLSDLLNQSATSMGQVDEAIRRIFALTENTKDLARKVSEDASLEGRAAMERARQEMDETRKRVSALGHTVKAVGERSQQIGEIMTLISGIADQTKLLALNAAILAAQAGDNGLGFAVVAGQIRELSEQTNASAKKVGQLISSVQQESAQAVREAALGTEAVTKSTEQVSRVAAALERIIAGAAGTRDLTEQIAASTQEQSAASSQVAKSITEISNMAQQLAAAALEQDATGQHILEIAEEMGAKAEQMTTVSQKQALEVGQIRDKFQGTAAIADRLGATATATKEAATALRESVDVIRQVVKENQARAAALRDSVELLSAQSEQVGVKLSTFVLD